MRFSFIYFFISITQASSYMFLHDESDIPFGPAGNFNVGAVNVTLSILSNESRAGT